MDYDGTIGGDQSSITTAQDESEQSHHSELITLAVDRFKQAYDAHKDDFEQCEKVQEFIAGDQWPTAIKAERERLGRPCLTLDLLTQYVRHVINTGLLRYRDIRVLAMDGLADDEVADIIAGIIRQITQTSTAKVAYETGLRHSCSVGFGYWRVRVQDIAGSPLQEIVIHKIREPRMVFLDPHCLYPDGRDARYAFVLTKMQRTEFKEQYPDYEEATSWHNVHEQSILPWSGDDVIVLAEYYYTKTYTDEMGAEKTGLFFAIMTPEYVLEEGKHHGDAMPIIRVVGDEYESKGKERKRGMINASSMDAQRTFNYSNSAFTENVALAPIAPFIAAAKQIDQHVTEWTDAHRVPRAVLTYDPISINGQVLPPPMRSQPAGIPQGWQGMMENMVNATQMIMGVSQPNLMGTGGIPVTSGVGIEVQQEPGDVNTFHFIDHWHAAIEQTGRVILAMIPVVYQHAQIVKVMGEDGTLDTATINPQQQQAVMKRHQLTELGIQKTISTSYNPMLGRYDATISTGPASATKRSSAAKSMLGLVQADPTIMQKAPDLIVRNMDIPGGDVLADRLKMFLPPGISDDDDAIIRQKVQQLTAQNQQLQQALQEAQQIVLGEREKAQADMQNTITKMDGELAKKEQDNHSKLIEQRLSHEGDLRLLAMKSHVAIETNTQNNIVKIILEDMKARNKLDLAAVGKLMEISAMEDSGDRLTGYAGVLDGLHPSNAYAPGAPGESAPAPMEIRPS